MLVDYHSGARKARDSGRVFVVASSGRVFDRADEEEGEQEDLGLSSGADQGDGEALGGNARKIEKRERGGRRRKTETRSSLLFSLLFKKQKWNGYERSEYEGKRRGWTATAVRPRSTAAR